jgi:PKD repeat protein
MKGKRSMMLLFQVLLLLSFMANFLHALPSASALEAPKAKFTFTPPIPYVNETILFNATASTPGNGTIILYSWNFGDNTTGTGMFINKSYTLSNNYTVTLTVTNSLGLNDTTSKIVGVLPAPAGAWLDLYNQRGGFGRNQPSGEFAPGEIVVLTALVTYNNAPVAHKPVSFEVRDSLGGVVLYRSAMTDENGLAKIDFALYRDCLSDLFGIWMVIATSSISEQIVSDTLTFRVSGPFLDISTQHPDPYSGKGLNESSDAFAPQELVILYGEAHWNCMPVENKLVAFEVKDPNGVTIDYRESPTNGSGIAMTSFRLASNATFGIYTVYGTVEIMGKNASDTLYFRVGWIIELLELKITDLFGAAKSTFSRGEYICYNVTAKNIAFTSRTATFTVVAYDAEGVPIGQISLIDVIISPGMCMFSLVSVQIPKWAFTGEAVTFANAYKEFPRLDGTAYCPEVSASLMIIP